jgi:hypothetical protein
MKRTGFIRCCCRVEKARPRIALMGWVIDGGRDGGCGGDR